MSCRAYLLSPARALSVPQPGIRLLRGYGHLWRLPTLLSCICWLAWAGGLAAQTADNAPTWQAMRVFVPESQVANVVTPDYLTIPITELESLLAEDARRRAQSAGQAVGIQRAAYVARWDEQLLTSNSSMWQVALPGNSQPLNIGRTSLAIDEPLGLASDIEPLTSHLRYLNDTRLQLIGGDTQAEYWFGFKAKTRRGESGQQSLELVLPKAVLATMLIAVPSHATVSSDVPCSRTDEPNRFLPSNWPASAVPALNADEQWFVLLLSGRDTCTLHFTPATQLNQFPYRLSVAKAQCDFVIEPAGLQVNSRFQLTKPPASRKLRIRLEEPLHVRSVQIDGVESTNWQTITDDMNADNTVVPSADAIARGRLIEVALGELSSGPLLVAVEAIGRMPLPFEGKLPRIEIADAFVLEGHGSLSSAEHVQIEDVSCKCRSLTTNSTSGTAAWRWQWTGKSPQLTTRVRASTNQWMVRSLTRFNVQTNVIVASAHVNLSSVNVQGNQVALKLANGWFVDSVELENAPPGVVATVGETTDIASELNVRWEDRRTDLDVRIVINAHYPQRTEVDSLRLQSSRIVSLAGADQVDSYVIESSGRFQLAIDPELLRLRIGEDELISWQRELLPRLGDVWIFRGTRDNLPTISLQRMRATLEARLHTIVTPLEKETVISYRVICRPISGSIDQIRLMLPIPPDIVAPTWTFVPAGNGANPRGLLLSSRATSTSAGETAFTLELSQDMSEEFQIEAELRLDNHSELVGHSSISSSSTMSPPSIPLPGIPQAVSQDAVVVVPAGYTLPQDMQSLEILPSGLCCANGRLMQVPVLNESEVIAARYDPNVITRIQLEKPLEKTRGAWVRKEIHQHWQHSGGRAIHRTSWEVSMPSSRVVELALPAGWNFDELTIDGRAIDVGASPGHQIRTRFPEGSLVRVNLQCSSQHSGGWYQWTKYDQPQSGLPVLHTHSIAWFPGSVIAGQGLPQAGNTSWPERLIPRWWWRWLSVDPWSADGHLTSSVGPRVTALDSHPILELLTQPEFIQGNWWPLELNTHSTRAPVWYAYRSLAGSMLFAMFLVLAALIYASCASHVFRWWILWTATIVSLCIVPATLLPLSQLLSLALVAATLVRFSVLVIQRSRPPVRRPDGAAHSFQSAWRSSAMSVLALFGFGLVAEPVAAQALSRTAARDREEIFGILIPVDSEFKVAGEYVYVPTRLYGLLNNTNQQDTKNSTVAVMAAFYSLSINNDPATLASSVGELTVELRVQAGRIDSELRLPFAKSELQLQRAYLGTQTLPIGEHLRPEGEVLTWRATDTERHTLRLVFRPRNITQKDGRGVLSVGIPAIPTSNLDVMGDDLRDVVVDAIGGMQLESPRSLTARLGPTNRLSISWPLIVNRSTAAQVQSDTWVHTRGEQAMALCQIRVRGAAALPSLLHVVGDSNWQPVGQDWEECRMLSADGASTAGRPVYSVQRSADNADDMLTIRVLLLPRSDAAHQTLPIPFLALQETASQQRSLAISSAETTVWKTNGTEAWQPLLVNQPSLLWDKAHLAEQATMFKVPAGTVSATLQRAPAAPETSVEETTEISLQFPEVKVKYVARWAQPVNGASTVRLHIPSGLRVDGAFVDALPARHTLHRVTDEKGAGARMNEVIVFVDSSLGGLQGVNLQLSMPARLNRVWRLPRPLLLDAKISSSVVQIYRGAELSSELQVVDGAKIALENVEVRPSPLLLNLHNIVGQAELGERFRDSAELPIEVRLTRTPANRNAKAVLRLMRSEQGWRAQLDAIIDVPRGEVNHVFFDLPRTLEASVREPIDANVPLMLWPSADTNRAILCVLPQLGSDGRAHVSLTIRLPSAGASQAITVPDIRLLGLSIPRPVLALPNSVSGQPARWTQVGRPLANNWAETQGLEELELDDFTLHEPSGSQLQAMWHSREGEDQTVRVLMTSIDLSSDRRAPSSAEICYWIEPRNQAYLSMILADGCQLIGAELNGRPIAWLQSDQRQVRLLLQPSYLPLRLRMFMRWSAPEAISHSNIRLQLPRLDAAQEGETLLSRPSTKSPQTVSQIHDATELSTSDVDAVLARAWMTTLIQSAPTASDRQADELSAWLPAWDPQALGLSSDLLLSVPAQFLPGLTTTTDEETSMSVSSFWEEYHKLLKSQRTRDASSASAMERPMDRQWYRLGSQTSVDQLSIDIADHGTANKLLWQWLIASGCLLASLVTWSIGARWLRTAYTVIAEHVWPLWLGLAIVSWVFLPVVWPSIVVAGCVLIVLWRRYRELKRDRQFILLPRAMRS